MPLLKKKSFETASIPEYLRDDEEVFHCEITNEIFRDYEEFCQRIILVNSMVWSCCMTGKSNLTYAEALHSENVARKSIKDFPAELRIPVLYLASKTKRTSFAEMAEDVFLYVKDRYFAGEIVEACFTTNNWRESHVLQVIAPNEEAIVANSKNKKPLIRSASPERFSPAAHLYRYEIEQLDADDEYSSQTMIIDAKHVRRKKGPFSKEKCKLFLKQFVEQHEGGFIVLKDSARQQYSLDKVTFEQIFDGPLPDFDFSKRVKNLVNGVHTKMQNGKKVRQETLAKYLKKQNYFGDENGKKLLDDMKRKEDEYKQKCAEIKMKKDEEKEKEKQKRREENLKMSLHMKEWYKPKEDLELEDQQVLPQPTPILCKIPAKYFGDSLMVLDFAEQFSTILDTQNFFPGGLTLELLERALTEKEVAGPFTDLIQMLLEALFNVQDEENAETKKESQADLNSEDMTENMSLSEASHLATLALSWSKTFQGMPLNRLPIYPMTVSEILRLHLLSSGARVNDSASKWRYQQRGGYASEDDPGLALRIKHPHILKALAIHNVNQLSIGDKLKILKCLIDQLLTYADVRDAIEEKLDKLKQSKADLRTLQVAERKREQDFVSMRLKIRRENKDNAEVQQKDLDKLQEEADKKRTEFEIKSQELIREVSNLQNVIGMDRGYRRYIKSTALSGIFVENDEQFPGICLDKIVEQQPELINADRTVTINHVRKLLDESTTSNGSDKENDNKNTPKKLNGIRNSLKSDVDIATTQELYMCTANSSTCPVHTMAGKPEWSFYHTPEQLNELISKLNKRGIREGELRQVLECDKDLLEHMLTELNPVKLNHTIVVPVDENPEQKPVPKKVRDMIARYEDSNVGYPVETDIAEVLHLTLVDIILEMEEKITSGCLGKIKVKDRKQWREHLLNRKYDLLDKTLVKKEDPVEKIKNEGKSSRPSTPDSIYRDPGRFLGISADDTDESDTNSVELTAEGQKTAAKALAIALAQVSQAVDSKHLKTPLGRADYSKKKQLCDVLERWEQSLLASTSFSQIFLHYCTLENCIMWSRSTLVQRCRVCRRGKESHNIVLCSGCFKGHHIYCLKPKLTAVPKGEWFCSKCKPPEEKQKTPRAKKTRKLFSIEDSDNEDVKEEDDKKIKKDKNSIAKLEVCEECGSGGHVLCCDFCPKVYHLECTQPPLRRIPRGEWKCHKCKGKSNGTITQNGKDTVFAVSDTEGELAQHADGIFIQRRCAAKARDKIHGFAKSLRRSSVGSESEADEENEPSSSSRRTSRRAESKVAADLDDVPLHNGPLQDLFADIMKHNDSWPFTRAVLKSEVPDYYEVITKPMDFGKIKYKLNIGEYQCDADVMADIALVFDNCNTYNTSEADVYKCGVRLLKFVEKRCSELGLECPENMMGEIEEEGPTKPKRGKHR